MFTDYDRKIKTILSLKVSNTDWKKVLENHKEMIGYIQHERLIHLLVTIFVGIVMSLSCLLALVFKETFLIIFCIPLLLLFTGYIIHYRFLENTTQSWYILEDEIKKYSK